MSKKNIAISLAVAIFMSGCASAPFNPAHVHTHYPISTTYTYSKSTAPEEYGPGALVSTIDIRSEAEGFGATIQNTCKFFSTIPVTGGLYGSSRDFKDGDVILIPFNVNFMGTDYYALPANYYYRDGRQSTIFFLFDMAGNFNKKYTLHQNQFNRILLSSGSGAETNCHLKFGKVHVKAQDFKAKVSYLGRNQLGQLIFNFKSSGSDYDFSLPAQNGTFNINDRLNILNGSVKCHNVKKDCALGYGYPQIKDYSIKISKIDGYNIIASIIYSGPENTAVVASDPQSIDMQAYYIDGLEDRWLLNQGQF